MSLPTPLKAQEILELVKEKLLQQQGNIEILEQSRFASKVSAMPSLKTESFILFNNINENVLYVARTEGLEIKEVLNIQEFKVITNKLSSGEQLKLVNIFNKIEVENTPKNPRLKM